MYFMQDIYQTFEFNKIQNCLLEHAKSEVGRQHINNLVMFKDFNELKENIDDLREALSIIQRFSPFPISNSADALFLINIAKKTGLLTPRDLNLIAEDVSTSLNIISFIKKIGLSYERINKKISSFVDLSSLQKEIRRVITSSLTVADNATPELKDIRREMRRIENEMQSLIASISFRYQAYLNDDNVTIRDGHFVLPVKTSDKSKVNGIIYDVSDSGATTFIEPLEVVQVNNKLTSLKVEENEEIRKILKNLTNLVLLQESEIINNNLIIGELDFLNAKSLYAIDINAQIADLSSNLVIDLKKVRHPLIDPKKVVSNNYYIDEDKRIVIISGPNAGGKTVSLKTVGLLVLMNQCGLALPVSSATLGFFNNIYIDIGDNQSLSDNLSTFSAHMSHIKEITELAKGKDLILLDELGTGTDPKEGEAIAISVVKFIEHKHCFAMISSHFEALKEYAFLSKNIENSSMIFDEEKLMPTYIFHLGAPGHSYALDVASRFGLDKDIILNAREFLSHQNMDESKSLIAILQKKVEENERLNKELQIEKDKLEKLEKKLKVEEANIKEKRENLLKEVNIEKRELIEKTKKEISEIISSLNNGDLKLHEIIELKKKVEDLEIVEEKTIFNEDIKVGDYISYPSLDLEGTVKSISGDNANVISSNGFIFKAPLVNLHKIEKTAKEKKKEHQTYQIDIKGGLGLELNIIGLRKEEAEIALAKYLDDCLLHHLSTVRIIHGFGSGVLRKMTHSYCDRMHFKYRSGDEHEGGSGATVVMLHD